MSNSIAPGSSADVNVKVTALTTNPNVPVTYKTIILKKNLVNGVNTLTQEMMSTTNIKYLIKYDYVLGEDITVPTNCLLEFDGGNLSGDYTLTGQNTSIQAGLVKIFNTNVTIAGTWNVPVIYDVWLESSNKINAIDSLFNLTQDNINNTVVINNNHYLYPSKIVPQTSCCLKINSNTTIILNGQLINSAVDGQYEYTVLYIEDKENIKIYGNGKIVGDKETHTGTIPESGMGIQIRNSRNIIIEGIEIYNCCCDGLYIGSLANSGVNKNICVNNVNIHDCRRQGISITEGEFVTIDGAIINDISGTAPEACIDIEPNTGLYAKNCTIKNCLLEGKFPIKLLNQHDYDSIENIIIDNCYINTGNIQDTCAFSTLKIKNVSVINCNINCSDVVHYNTNGLKELLVDNCTITGNGTLYLFPNETFTNNNVEANPYLASTTEGDRRCIIEGNKIKGSITGGVFAVVTNNYIDGYVNLQNSIIENNIITGEDCGGDSQKFKVYVNSSIVRNNKINYSGETSLWSILHTISNSIIENNNLSGNDKSSYGIYDQSNQSNVIGNTFSGYTYAVYGGSPTVCIDKYPMFGTTRPTLSNKNIGNIFFDTSISPARPIWWNGTAWVDATGATV